jgi:alkylated DNA nucleotide flippase Atl1
MPTVEEILQFLDAEKVRATYGAVADVLGISPRSVGALLGSRRPKASWVVNAASGEPTGYSDEQKDVSLRKRDQIIKTGTELLRRMGTTRTS